MPAASTPTSTAPQEVCIDLPGESVQCWRSGDKVRVVLRKHRDVIFDLKFGGNSTYTVESTVSDFYNARDKKLMYAKRKDIVKFKDGERLHLWVTRNFKGELLLKSGGKLIMKIEPNALDQQQYDDDPKTKMAPIIIAMGQHKAAPPQPAAKPMLGPVLPTPPANAPGSPSSTLAFRPIVPTLAPVPLAAPVEENCPVVCVVDVDVKTMPKKIADYFAKGGQKVVDADMNDVITRNWVWGQAAGAAAYVRDNWAWLRASIERRHHSSSFKLVSAKIRYVRGKARFFFSGYSKYNTVFGPGAFGPGNEKIMTIFSGVGQTKSAFTAVAKGVAGSFKSNALVSFIFGSVTSYAEWQADAAKDGYDLAASLIMTVIKTIVAAAIVVAIVALVVIIVMKLFAVSLCVLAVGALTIVAGFAVNYAVDAVDKALGKTATGDKKNTDGLAGALAPMMRDAGKAISETWDYLMSKFPNDYKAIQF